MTCWSGIEADAAVEEHAEHQSADMSPAVVQTNNSNMSPEVQEHSGKTDTAGVSSPAKSMVPAVVRHAASTEVRLRCSSKSRKAPPIPPPPTLVPKETTPLSTTSYDNVSEVSSVKDDNGENRRSDLCQNVEGDVSPCSNSTCSTTNNLHSKPPSSSASTSVTNPNCKKIESRNDEHCENVRRDVSPCNKLTPTSASDLYPKPASSSASSADSKPALKPKPVTHTVARESCTSVEDSSALHSVKAPTSLHGSKIASSSESVPPVYAVVNKPRTLRSTSNIDGEISNVTKSPGTNITVSRSKSEVATGAAAPKKPPRTFAHSEYMKLKSCSLPRSSEPFDSEKSSSLPQPSEPVISSKKMSSLPQSSEPSTGSEKNSSLPRSSEASVEYDEVGSSTIKTVSDGNTDTTTKTDLDNVDGDCTVETQMQQKSSQVVTECCGTVSSDGKVPRRQQSDKLPAPPRPPPPSFPQDNSRSSRLSVADVDLSTTCSSTEDCGTDRQERCSSMLLHDRQKSSIKPSSASDDDDDDGNDIYAVPGDVNSTASAADAAAQRGHLTCNTSASSETALHSVRDDFVSNWFVFVV